MAQTQLSSILVVGVDLGTSADWTRRSTDVLSVVRRLSQSFARRQIAATWMVPSGQLAGDKMSQFVQVIKDVSCGHEFGLRWEESPIESASHVFRFHHALLDRLQWCEQHWSIRLNSFAADPSHPLPYVALAKAGIRTLRATRQRHNHTASFIEPQTLRYGLWGIPVSCFWPHPRRLMRRFLQRQITHQLGVAAQHQRALHVVVDLPTLAASDAESPYLDGLLDQVVELRESSDLQTARMCDVDRVLTARTIARRPNRSILRRAS